ncbi:MAG: glycosyltransferase family 2 protein, partial [Sedimentisphaerales bacterium]
MQKKERKPKASVLMPVYNTVLFLEEAVESILTQSFEDYEFVIVDDGSNDGSEKILAAFARKDARVRIIRNDKNMGIVYSLNRGLRECCGKYIVRMDSDDVALPNRLSKQIELMEAHPNITVLSASVSYIDASGRETGVIRRSQVTKSLLRKNGIIHPTVVI